jgi:hypothetical protein
MCVCVCVCVCICVTNNERGVRILSSIASFEAKTRERTNGGHHDTLGRNHARYCDAAQPKRTMGMAAIGQSNVDMWARTSGYSLNDMGGLLGACCCTTSLHVRGATAGVVLSATVPTVGSYCVGSVLGSVGIKTRKGELRTTDACEEDEEATGGRGACAMLGCVKGTP